MVRISKRYQRAIQIYTPTHSFPHTCPSELQRMDKKMQWMNWAKPHKANENKTKTQLLHLLSCSLENYALFLLMRKTQGVLRHLNV